jgi:hypothetical protein
MRREVIYILVGLLLAGVAVAIFQPSSPALAQDDEEHTDETWETMLVSGVFSSLVPTQPQKPIVVNDENFMFVIADRLIFKINKATMHVEGVIELQTPEEKAIRLEQSIRAIGMVFEALEEDEG